MSEPSIINVLREDHKKKWHDAPNKPNKYCPLCQEAKLVREAEQFLASEADND